MEDGINLKGFYWEMRSRSERQFGRTAEAYSYSKSHRQGESLEFLRSYLAKFERRFRNAIDIATGAGFAAFEAAAFADSVLSTDITPEMLDQARRLSEERGIKNIQFARMAAEDISLGNGSVDLVICRTAPHHFVFFDQFLDEVYRILEPGGVFIVCDTAAPEDPSAAKWMNDIEERRDPSHIWNRSPSEWRQVLIGKGFRITDEGLCKTWHEFEDWTERAKVPLKLRDELRKDISTVESPLSDVFNITTNHQGLISWTWDAAIFRSEKDQGNV